MTRARIDQPVDLEWYEFAGAVMTGLLRFANGNVNGLNHASTYQRGWIERLQDETVGACAERCWAKLLDQYWDGSVGTFHNVPDAPDNVEIRGCLRPDGSLIVRDNDPAGRWYCLFTGEPPRMTYRGGIWGHEVRQHPEWTRDPHRQRPAWFVPQDALT